MIGVGLSSESPIIGRLMLILNWGLASPLYMADTPLQENTWDCGVFVMCVEWHIVIVFVIFLLLSWLTFAP